MTTEYLSANIGSDTDENTPFKCLLQGLCTLRLQQLAKSHLVASFAKWWHIWQSNQFSVFKFVVLVTHSETVGKLNANVLKNFADLVFWELFNMLESWSELAIFFFERCKNGYHFVDLEEICEMLISFQTVASIQPKTSLPKFVTRALLLAITMFGFLSYSPDR